MARPLPPALVPPADAPPFDDGELDDYLAKPLVNSDDVQDPVRVHRWQIDDEGGAEWAMRMLAAIELHAAAVELQYREWLAPIERWRGDELGRIAPRAAFFRGHLERWGLRRRAEDPKIATLRLPSGEVATRRANEPRVEVVDEDAFLAWAGDHLSAETYEQVVKISQSVLLPALRKLAAVKVTGDVEEVAYRIVVELDGTEVEIPGLTAVVPEMTATVKPTVG